MIYTANDVEAAYKIKCSKYKPEDLTEALKEILYDEAISETQEMNYINSRSGLAGM